MTYNSSDSFIYKYCFAYAHLFREVRTFENFRHLHLGMLSDIKRKSLPAIAGVLGLRDAQPLHNFLTDSPWSSNELRNQRLALTLQMLKGQSIKLIINETGDKKKGKDTDYVAQQYISNLGKIANGIVSINAYGVLGDITFPLMFKIYKPKDTLKEGDSYKTKSQLASEIINELLEFGFKFDLVVADSFYGESETLVTALNKYSFLYVVVARSHHERQGLPGNNVTCGEWKRFYRTVTNGTVEYRYMQEIRFGETALQEGLRRQLPATGNPSSALAPPQATALAASDLALPEALGEAKRYPKGDRKPVTYWKITTDLKLVQKNESYSLLKKQPKGGRCGEETLSQTFPGREPPRAASATLGRPSQTWYLMTNLMGDVEQKLGNPYGICKWIEYSFKQAKNELGWADFRVTDYKQIEKWWEVVMSAYLLLTLLSRSSHSKVA